MVFIHLTLKGRKAYHHHAEFHRKMTDAVLDVLDEKEALVLAKALDSLTLSLDSINHNIGRTRAF